MRVFVIRPEPGFSATMKAGAERGLDMAGEPLFKIAAREWEMPEGAFDGLLFGSANVIRHGGANLAALTHLPVYAVGAATASAARNCGFSVAAQGKGGLQNVVSALACQHLRLLRLCGEERAVLSAPDRIEITDCVVYESKALSMSAGFAESLKEGGTVLLHSAAAARHFRAQCDGKGVDRARLHLIALAPAIADAAGEGWAETNTAEELSDEAMLNLL